MSKKVAGWSIALIILICCTLLVYKSNSVNNSERNNDEVNISQDIQFVDSETADIIKSTNNAIDKDEVITRKEKYWDIDQHTDINEQTIKDIQKKYDIECLRNVNGYYYSVHKCDTGHYAYIMYKLDVNRKTLVVADYEFLSSIIHKSDFKSIKVNESTEDDVRKIDPSSNALVLSTRAISYSTMADGGKFVLEYSGRFVSDIKYIPPTPHNVLTVILKKDFPSLTASTGKSNWLKVTLAAVFSVLLIGAIGVGIYKIRKRWPFKKKLIGRKAILGSVALILVLCCTYLGYKYKVAHNSLSVNNFEKQVAQDIMHSDYGTTFILKRVDNTSDKDDLITKQVGLWKVKNVEIGKQTISDIEDSLGMQCIRKTEHFYYSVHKCTDGNYAYISYRKDPKINTLFVSEVEILNSNLSVKDFNKIKVGKSTLNDVKKIDPSPIIETTGGGKISVSTLADSGKYVMVYGEDGENSTVSEIKYIPPSPNSVLTIMFKKDFPAETSIWRSKPLLLTIIIAFSVFVIVIVSVGLIKLKTKALS